MFDEKLEVSLSNGTTFKFDPDNPKELFETIVTDVLIPFYKESNDWNQSIRKAINVIDYIRRTHNIPEFDYRKGLLKEIEGKLGDEIGNIEGLDKIEILFLNMDDYTDEIFKLMNLADITREERIRTLGNLIASLNTFEISELLYHYVDFMYKNKEN